MAMPIDLVFVRHGESEQNLALNAEKKGDSSLYTHAFRARHAGQHRLTGKGQVQAKAAGEWLKKHDLSYFDRRYVSDFVRAKETAGLLGTDGPGWYVDHMLREREWGDFDSTSFEERQEMSRKTMITKDTDPFYWIPPNGESIAQLTLRLRKLFDTLHRECSDKRVIVVCHGEVMWAVRQMLEQMQLSEWIRQDLAKDPLDRIHNCQILQYTRRNPETGELAKHIDWKRSICPTDLTLSRNEWERIVRKRFTNTELLEIAHSRERLFGDIDK